MVSDEDEYTFVVTSDGEYVANFALDTFTVTATAFPENSGTISGAGTYEYGSPVTLTATAGTGYHFVGWLLNQNMVSTSNPYTFDLFEDCDFEALFELNTYEITVSSNPEEGGYVWTDTAYYYHGDECTLYASPNTEWGYHFVNWTKNGTVVSEEDEYTFVVTADGEYVANFALDTFNVAVIIDPEGAGNVTGGGYHEFGDSVTLTATANTGYEFSYWSSLERFDGGGDDPTLSFYLYNDTTIVAHFSRNSYLIEAYPDIENAGSVIGGDSTYYHGDTCTLTAVANPGYHFVNWTKGDDMLGESPTLTFVVTSPGTYVAHFEQDVYTISATTNPEDAGIITGTGTNFHYSDTCTLLVTANQGRTFSNWTKNGVVVSEDAEYTFLVTESASFVANFDAIPYTIYAFNEPEEGGSVTGAGVHNYGTTCTLKAVPATGYHFVNWLVNAVEVGTQDSISFTVTNDSTFVAVYELNSYAITAMANPEAGGSVAGDTIYYHGDTCTLVATANTGYTFLNWTKNGTVVSTSANYSFVVTEAATYVANFQINSYTVAATANPTAGGTLTGAGTYNYGSTCTLTATANEGYTFVNWTKGSDIVSTDASFSFTVTQDSAFVAHFSLNSYDITATADPEEGGTFTGDSTYYHGTTCTLTATANEGYTFVNWTKGDEIASTNATFSFTVTAAGAYVAHFSHNQYEISATVNPTAAGSITGTGTYYHGSTCTLTVTPNEGYTFVNWTKNGEAVGTSTTLSFTVTGEAAYVANFNINTYDITATANPANGGSVTGAGNYTYNTSCTLTATAATGYTFVNWTKNGEAVGTTPSITFTVTNDAAYVANFSLNSYEITATANPASYGTVTGAGTYNHGDNCTLTAAPASDSYLFLNWTKNGTVVSTNPSYTFTVTGAASYVANFIPNQYEITATANPANGGSVTGAGTYNYNTSCTLTATASTGYTFVNWTKNGTVVSTSASYTFTVLENANYVAHFSLNSYTITASASPASYGTVTGAGTYNHGESCTLTATPYGNSHLFLNWTKNGTVVSTNPTFTFTVTENASYVAHFILITHEITATANPANGGSITGAGTYNHGSVCTLTATPNTGYTFLNWTKDGTVVSQNASYSFTVNADASYVANFSLNMYTITLAADPQAGGTVTGAGTYNYGENCTVNANPNDGYTFINWTRNGTVVSTDASYSFTLTENVSLVAHFRQEHYNITVAANPEEGGSVTGGGSFTYGQTCTLTATANTGYTFTNWTKNGTVVSNNASYSFSVTDNGDYVANFTVTQYTITVIADPAEGGNVYGGGTFPSGTIRTLRAIANEHYVFVNWTKDGNIVSTNSNHPIIVTENAEYVAHFRKEAFEISAMVDPEGTGNIVGTGFYNYGDICTLTVTPEHGYMLISWTLDGAVASTDETFSFVVTEDRTYIAHMDMDGIEEQGDITISLFPNPAKNKLTVEASEPVKMLEIYNINGALVYRQSDCTETTIINVDSYATGTYMIRLTTDNTVVIRRFVKE